MALGNVIREKPTEKRQKASLTEIEENEQQLNDQGAHYSSKQSQLSRTNLKEGVEGSQTQPCLDGQKQKVGGLQNTPQSGLQGLPSDIERIEEQEAGGTRKTSCEESQFFTCPTSVSLPDSSMVANLSFNSEDVLPDEATAEEPGQKRASRSTECSDASLNFATAPQPPESHAVDKQSAKRMDLLYTKAKRMGVMAIACRPPARLERVTSGQLCTAPPGSYRLLGVVVKASLEVEEVECSEPKVRLEVKDDEGEVSLMVNEKEVELMCRDFLVRQSLSVEQGLLEMEGKVADLGVEKTVEDLLIIHSRMI